MSYVQANTSNPLGRRGLGRLGRMGWDNAPYPMYQQPGSMMRLNGDFKPSGPDRSTSAHGAITYRIDPRTGNYNFYRTDIKPRGVFLQNTFQHPAPEVISALGMSVLPIGKSVSASTLRRGRTSQEPMIQMRPGFTLSGLGCNDCGGRCNSQRGMAGMRGLRGMGDVPADMHIDSDGCIVDSDGVRIQCPNAQGVQAPTQTFPGVSVVPTAIADVVQAFLNPPTVRTPVATQPASWFNQSSSVGGAAIPNSLLAIGGALFAALALEGSKGRRR